MAREAEKTRPINDRSSLDKSILAVFDYGLNTNLISASELEHWLQLDLKTTISRANQLPNAGAVSTFKTAMLTLLKNLNEDRAWDRIKKKGALLLEARDHTAVKKEAARDATRLLFNPNDTSYSHEGKIRSSDWSELADGDAAIAVMTKGDAFTELNIYRRSNMNSSQMIKIENMDTSPAILLKDHAGTEFTAFGNEVAQLQIYELLNPKNEIKLKVPGEVSIAPVFYTDRSGRDFISVVTRTSRVIVFDFKTKEKIFDQAIQLGPIVHKRTSLLHAPAFTQLPDGTIMIAVPRADGVVSLFDLDRKNAPVEITVNVKAPVSSVQWYKTNGGQTSLAASSRGQFAVYPLADLTNPTLISLQNYAGSYFDIHTSSSGDRVVALAGEGGHVHILNLDKLQDAPKLIDSGAGMFIVGTSWNTTRSGVDLLAVTRLAFGVAIYDLRDLKNASVIEQRSANAQAHWMPETGDGQVSISFTGGDGSLHLTNLFQITNRK